MITLFSIPKPFVGHFGAIQRNALQSWRLLDPRCDILLIGDEPGTAQAANDIGAAHVNKIERNKYGTPLLNDVFRCGESASSHRLLCYVNADIILTNEFLDAVQRVMRRKRKFLMVGRRTDLDLQHEELLDFSPGWQDRLGRRIADTGHLQGPTHIDYFVFSRGMWGRIPPFAVGRFAWDNWLIWRARMLKVPAIDASGVVTVIHQNHNYQHAVGGYKGARHGPEAKQNLALAGGLSKSFTIWDSTHVLTKDGLEHRSQTELGGGIWSYRRSVRLGA